MKASQKIEDGKAYEPHVGDEDGFASAFKYASIGMALVSPEGRWLKVNEAVCRLTGYSEEELAHKTFQDITHPDDLEADLDQLRQLLAGQIPSYHMEKRYFHKDGHLVWVLLNVSLVRGADGRPSHVISQIQDITERKQAEQEMIRHEILTPLNGIIGMTDLLRGTELTEEQRDFLETIHASGENLLTIVNDVLDFSKIEFGKLELDQHPFRLPALIDDVVGLLRFRITRKKLEFHSTIDRHLPVDYLADANRISQVLINLVSNAIKFTEEGGITLEVGAGTARPGDQPGMQRVLFRVRDTGIGIAADRLDRLFKIFSQVDASTTRRYGGSGLGLAICQKLVELMGGAIHVESTPGRGSIFSFELPLALAHPNHPAAHAGADADERRHFRVDPEISDRPKVALQILVVEDNATNQKVARQILKRLGYETDLAVNGVEAVRAAEAKAYDLILMDIHMPEMDGMEATRCIRARPSPGGAPKIIALTADVLKGERERCLNGGMDDYLTKPIKIDILKSIIEDLQAGKQREG